MHKKKWRILCKTTILTGCSKNPLKTLAENLVVEELKKVGIANVSDVDKKAVSRILLKEIDPPSGQGGTY